jgi:hypothetical protein
MLPPPPPPQTYPAVSIEIKPSIILPGEIGVFATRRFAKDSIIVPAAHFADARLLEWAVFKTLDAVTKRKLMGYCPGTPEGLLAPADLNYISVAWQMNHSCQPNVGFNAADDFVAMRAIRRGEELCWDYAFAESNPKFRMKCRCGAVDCRGVVTGKDWQHLVSEPNKRNYFLSDLRRLAQDLASGEGEANRRPASANSSKTEHFHDLPPPPPPQSSPYWSMTEGVFNCLIDEERTMAFAKAIATTVRPGDVVVDMGAGSGVLAMLAARAGAKKVYAIEIDRSNIATLNAVFRANALEDRIVLIHGDVCKVDLPEKVDVIIGEMIATALIEELQVPAMNNMLRFAKRDRTCDARSAQRLPDVPRSGA